MEQPVLSFSPQDTHQPPRLQTQKAKRHLTSLLLVRINTLNGRRLLSLHTPRGRLSLPCPPLECGRSPGAGDAPPRLSLLRPIAPRRGPAEERRSAPSTAPTLSPPLASRQGGRASFTASDFKTIGGAHGVISPQERAARRKKAPGI